MRVIPSETESSTSTDMLQLLSLPECDRLIKNEFDSDEDFLTEDIKLPFGLDGNLSDVLESPKKNGDNRKNKRKNLTPQRAVQAAAGGNTSSVDEGVSPENSQDTQNSSYYKSEENSNDVPKMQDLPQDFMISDSELIDGEDLLRDINEEDIFKGIQEETDGEKVNEELIDNVKEEWRAHWGIKCNMCEKVFPYKSEFDNHYIESYGLVPVYTCSFCNKSSEKYTTFRSHIYRHITEGRYKCKECDKGFSLQSMLQLHTLGKHGKAKPFQCDECGKSFVTKPGLKIHIRKHNSDVKEDYPCFLCGKVLHTRGGLTSHINVHRLGRRFMCDICGKTFTQKVNMQQHARQHTGDKPYACDKCDKTFAEKSHLARHHSFHSNYRPYKCEVCSKMYKTERCLKVHSMVHAEARPFVCMYCNKGFLSSTKLKQHYNVHTGERPYACKYCERKFTNYPNWLKHTRRRHKVDHKTGEQLEPKPPKAKEDKASTPVTTVKSEVQNVNVETVTVQASTSNIQQIPVESATLDALEDPLSIDLNLFKTEDLFMQQQNLINIPIDDNILTQPNLFNGIGGNNFMVPYFQNSLPSQQSILQNNVMGNVAQSQFQMQLGEFVSSNLLQSTLPCE